MSSDQKKTILNTRERWTSSKYNTQVQMGDRNLQEAMRHLVGSDENLSGVLSGLIASISVGTFDIQVGRGLALLFDGTKVEPDSQYRWVEVLATDRVTASAADPVNPRWDVVEIAPGVQSTGLFSRDIFDPSLGTFTPQNVAIEEEPAPVLQVRAGTPAATPALPAGAVGQIPLAYIFIPAAAASIPVTNIIHTRPLLRPPGAVDVGSDVIGGLEFADARGGGIEIATLGLAFTTREASGRFPRSRVRWGIPDGTAFTLGTTQIAGGAFPVADDVIYFYAVPPPYPAGYSALAPREFVPETGAAAEINSVTVGMVGAILVASPEIPNVDRGQGEPAAPLGTLSDPAFGGAATLDSAAATYMGATWYDLSDDELEAQSAQGAIVSHGVDAASREHVEHFLDADFPETAPGITFSAWSSRGGGADTDLEFPVTAHKLYGQAQFSLIQTTGALEVVIRDRRVAATGGAPGGAVINLERLNTGGTVISEQLPIVAFPEKTTGLMRLLLGSIDASSDFRLWWNAYEDAVLAVR